MQANTFLNRINNKKIKNPYTLQYLKFQERLEGKRPKSKGILTNHKANILNDIDPYNVLHVAKNIINKGHEIWQLQKQNNFGSIDDQCIKGMRNRIMSLKMKKNQYQPLNIFNSQQFKNQKRSFTSKGSRVSKQLSRALSQNVKNNNKQLKNGPLNFLDYKRNKRLLSAKIKYN